MSSIQKISGFSKAILAFSLLLLAGQIVSIFFTSKDVAVGHIAFQIFENLLMIIVVFLPVNIGRTNQIGNHRKNREPDNIGIVISCDKQCT